MGPTFALAALMWVVILAYAGVQSGLQEIKHCKLGILDALRGIEAECATGGATGESSSDASGGTGGVGALNAAKKYLGCPYLFGGTQCHPGIDCSGLTMQAWRTQGVNLPHQSAAQYAMVKARGWGMDTATARNTPGALLFFIFRPGAEVHHVAMAVGDGTHMVSADHAGKPVSIEAIFGGGSLVGGGLPVSTRQQRSTPPPGGGGGGKKEGGGIEGDNVIPLRQRRLYRRVGA